MAVKLEGREVVKVRLAVGVLVVGQEVTLGLVVTVFSSVRIFEANYVANLGLERTVDSETFLGVEIVSLKGAKGFSENGRVTILALDCLVVGQPPLMHVPFVVLWVGPIGNRSFFLTPAPLTRSSGTFVADLHIGALLTLERVRNLYKTSSGTVGSQSSGSSRLSFELAVSFHS